MLNQMRRIFIVLVFFSFAIVAASVTQAQFAKDNRRAISLNTCVEEDQLPDDVKQLLRSSALEQYQDKSSLNGMVQMTVREAGWSNFAVYNERPGNGKRPTKYCSSLLNPDRTVWVMNGEKQPLLGYLDGCFKAGSPNFKNRIIVPPPTIVEKDKIVYRDKALPVEPMCVNRNLTLDQAQEAGLTITSEGECLLPVAKVEECLRCDKLAYVANKEGIWNTKQVVTSAGVGGGGTAVASNGGFWSRVKKGGIGAGLSTLGTVLARVPESNRGDESFTFTRTPYGKAPTTFTLTRGQSYNQDGLKLDWLKDHWEVDSEYCFGSFAPKTTFVFTPVILVLRNGKDKTAKVPTKTLPTSGSQVPIRPRGDNGTIPTRPTLGGNALAESSANAGTSQQSGNVATTEATTPAPAGYTRVLMGGQWVLVKLL